MSQDTTRQGTIPREQCRLPELVSRMPERTDSTLFCHRGGFLVGIPYPECFAAATTVAAALHKRGVRPGDTVAIHGATSYEWVLADLACLISGAISVALYPNAPLPRAIAAAGESRCRIVLTDRIDSGSVQTLAEAGFEVILLDADGKGPSGIATVDEIARAGAGSRADGKASAVFRPVDRGNGPFTIVSTSGTLSEPKLFAVHSAPLLFTMDRFAEIYGISGQDRLLLYLPLSHLPQRMMLYWGLGAGMDFILSSPAHMMADTARLAPTLHVAVPRSLEALHTRARRRARKGTEDGAEILRSMFGAGIRSVFVGSAASDPAVLSDLLDAGLNVYEVYGTTELGMVGLNTPDGCRIGTAGQAIPWGKVCIDPGNDEIMIQTPTPFLYGRLDGDGEIRAVRRDPSQWERTGDVGALDADGYLTVLGRLRDFLALPNGEKVFVRPLEDSLARLADAELCVISRDNGALRALLFFEPEDSAGEDHRIPRLRRRITEFNLTVHPWERVQSFAIVTGGPSVDNGTLTETTKIRRHKIDEIYARNASWHNVREKRD